MGLFSSTKASRAKKEKKENAAKARLQQPQLIAAEVAVAAPPQVQARPSVMNVVARNAGFRGAPTGALGTAGASGVDPLFAEIAQLERAVLAEGLCHGAVAKDICLAPAFFRYTAIGHQSRRVSLQLRESPALAQLARSEMEFSTLAKQIGVKAGVSGSGDTFKSFRGVCSTEQQRALLWFSMTHILEKETADGIRVLLLELQDRQGRCSSARKHGYDLIVRRGAELCASDESKSMNGAQVSSNVLDITTKSGAQALVYRCFADYVEDHKARAWVSGVEGPAIYYFRRVGDREHENHVNVHGLNAYLTMIDAGLGMTLPLIADETDNDAGKGLGVYWTGLGDSAWTEGFGLVKNFGRESAAISNLKVDERQKGKKYLATRSAPMGHFNGMRNAKDIRNEVKKAGGGSQWAEAKGGADVRLFLERFAHFFSEEFFVKRCFENLCAEHKPEHTGFKRACNTLFHDYKRAYGLGGGFAEDEDIVDHLYDELITELDVKRAVRFFGWCGLLRLSEDDRRIMELAARDSAMRRSQLAAAAARRDSNGIEQFQTALFPTLSEEVLILAKSQNEQNYVSVDYSNKSPGMHSARSSDRGSAVTSSTTATSANGTGTILSGLVSTSSPSSTSKRNSLLSSATSNMTTPVVAFQSSRKDIDNEFNSSMAPNKNKGTNTPSSKNSVVIVTGSVAGRHKLGTRGELQGLLHPSAEYLNGLDGLVAGWDSIMERYKVVVCGAGSRGGNWFPQRLALRPECFWLGPVQPFGDVLVKETDESLTFLQSVGGGKPLVVDVYKFGDNTAMPLSNEDMPVTTWALNNSISMVSEAAEGDSIMTYHSDEEEEVEVVLGREREVALKEVEEVLVDLDEKIGNPNPSSSSNTKSMNEVELEAEEPFKINDQIKSHAKELAKAQATRRYSMDARNYLDKARIDLSVFNQAEEPIANKVVQERPATQVALRRLSAPQSSEREQAAVKSVNRKSISEMKRKLRQPLPEDKSKKVATTTASSKSTTSKVTPISAQSSSSTTINSKGRATSSKDKEREQLPPLVCKVVPKSKVEDVVEDDKNTCPICMQEKLDIRPVKHLVKPRGDASDHRMCGACMDELVKLGKGYTCPFCNELTTVVEFAEWIEKTFKRISSSSGNLDASAATLEQIQIFELEHEGEIAVLRRAYKQLAEHEGFGKRVDRALASSDWGQKRWMMDCAGVFWRLHAASESGELIGLSSVAKKRLARANEVIWEPFKDRKKPPQLSGHEYGALYMQATVAWLCALRSGMSGSERWLSTNARNVGFALSRWKKNGGNDWRAVKERLQQNVLEISHIPVWGSLQEDVVYMEFIKKR